MDPSANAKHVFMEERKENARNVVIVFIKGTGTPVLSVMAQEYVNIKDDVRSVKSVKVGQCANIIEFGEDVMIVVEMRSVSTTDSRGNAKSAMNLPFARIRRVNTPVKYVRTNK
jgi:hypothetical protein